MKKIYIILAISFLVILSVFLGYKAYSSHVNTDLNWIGKTKNNEWVGEIHYDKKQKSYSGNIFWRGNNLDLKSISHINFKYYEGKKVITSSKNDVKIYKGSFGFLEFSSQPKEKAVIKFSYLKSGKKIVHTINFHPSTYHYPFYSNKNPF